MTHTKEEFKEELSNKLFPNGTPIIATLPTEALFEALSTAWRIGHEDGLHNPSVTPKEGDKRTVVKVCLICAGEKGWYQNDGHDGSEWVQCVCGDGTVTGPETLRWVRG
jgi:hypothetical protein